MERASASVRGGVEKLAQRADDWKRAVGQRLQRPDGASTPASGNQAQAGRAGDGAAVEVPKADMTREQALEALGLEAGATASEIEDAYKARARQNGSLNGSEKLSRAREVLRGGARKC